MQRVAVADLGNGRVGIMSSKGLSDPSRDKLAASGRGRTARRYVPECFDAGQVGPATDLWALGDASRIRRLKLPTKLVVRQSIEARPDRIGPRAGTLAQGPQPKMPPTPPAFHAA